MPGTGYVTSASQIFAEKMRDSNGHAAMNASHVRGASCQSRSARYVSPPRVILSFCAMEASLIRRSKGSLADKEQTVHGVAEPQLHAGRKPSPQPVLSVWLLHLTTGTVDGLAGAGFVSTYFANGDGGYWQGPSPTPLTPTPITHFPASSST